MYSPLLSSVFPSVCFYSEAMVVSKMAAGFSELQQRKVGFLALYDVRVGVFEFVFFVKLQNSCYLGKENPLCVLYLSWGLQDPRQTKQLPIWWHLFSGFYILLDISWGEVPDPVLDCFLLFFYSGRSDEMTLLLLWAVSSSVLLGKSHNSSFIFKAYKPELGNFPSCWRAFWPLVPRGPC